MVILFLQALNIEAKDFFINMKTYQIAQYIVDYFPVFIGGPSASIFTNSFEAIEPLIQALCYITGDDSEDYTATNLIEKE